jgi:hypothetical protein
MDSNADRESYWTLIEAAIWIRTRDLNQVSGIVDPIKSPISAAESKQALEESPQRCRNGSVRSVGRRCIYYDSRFKRAEPAGTSFLWRRLPEGAPSDVTEGIPPHEWPDLEWEPPVDGKLTGNLRSRLLRRRAWMLVQFSRSDVMREWPSHVPSEARFERTPVPNASELDSLKLASDKIIRQTIDEVYNAAEADGEKAPNIKELPTLVLRKLQQQGYTASKRHIQLLGDELDFKKRRRPPGATVSSERRARQK